MSSYKNLINELPSMDEDDLIHIASEVNLEIASRGTHVMDGVSHAMMDTDAANYDEFCAQVSEWPEPEAEETTSSDD